MGSVLLTVRWAFQDQPRGKFRINIRDYQSMHQLEIASFHRSRIYFFSAMAYLMVKEGFTSVEALTTLRKGRDCRPNDGKKQIANCN